MEIKFATPNKSSYFLLLYRLMDSINIGFSDEDKKKMKKFIWSKTTLFKINHLKKLYLYSIKYF